MGRHRIAVVEVLVRRRDHPTILEMHPTVLVYLRDSHHLTVRDAKARLLSIRCQQEAIVRRNLDRPPLVHVERLRLVGRDHVFLDRKSTRLNSSHTVISYAVFCLKKKKKTL